MSARGLVALTLLISACSGAGDGDDAGTTDGSMDKSPLVIEIEGPKDPIYPCAGVNCDARVEIPFTIRITNNGPGVQDLRVVVPLSSKWPWESATIEGGINNPAIGALVRDIAWLGPGAAPLTIDVKVATRVFAIGDDQGMWHGELSVPLDAKLLRYGEVVGESPTASVQLHLADKVTPQALRDIYSAAVDKDYVYVSATPIDGPNADKAGLYRVAKADGTLTTIATHAGYTWIPLPFALDGDTPYYVTRGPDGNHTILMKAPPGGVGMATQVPLPKDALFVHGIAFDETYLYVAIETVGSTQYIYRARKTDPTSDTLSSKPLGDLQRDTLVVTSSYVLVERTNPSPHSFLRLDKSTLVETSLLDGHWLSDRRALTCNDALCFYTEAYVNKLWQIPIGGGMPVELLSNSAFRVLLDGPYVYTNQVGLVRVGPDKSPAPQRLLQNGAAYVHASDESYVYFSASMSARLWRIHK